jgi:hypothetical protein
MSDWVDVIEFIEAYRTNKNQFIAEGRRVIGEGADCFKTGIDQIDREFDAAQADSSRRPPLISKLDRLDSLRARAVQGDIASLCAAFPPSSPMLPSNLKDLTMEQKIAVAACGFGALLILIFALKS